MIIGSVRFRSYLTRNRAELAIKNWFCGASGTFAC